MIRVRLTVITMLTLPCAMSGAEDSPAWRAPLQNAREPQESSSFWIDVPDRPPRLADDGPLAMNTTPAGMRAWELNVSNGKALDYATSPEQAVFFREIEHVSDPSREWKLRIGKGSQIYSVLQDGREFIGEQAHINCWLDRVLQSTTTIPESVNYDVFHTVMMHQAGIKLTPEMDQLYDVPYFSPILAYEFANQDPEDRSFKTISHMFINQNEKDGHWRPWEWQPKALLWQYIRDLGDGVFERVAVIYNYGTTDLGNFTDMWCGFTKFEPIWEDTIYKPLREANPRRRLIPIVSQPDGSWQKGGFTKLTSQDVSVTGGWTALCLEEEKGSERVDEASRGIGYVFGAGHVPSTNSRFGYGANVTDDSDKTVISSNRRLTQKPGDLWYSKHYFIFGDLAKIQATAAELMPYAAYGQLQPYTLEPSERQAGTIALDRYGSEIPVPGVRLWDKPIPNGVPIFTMLDSERQEYFFANDPYVLTPRVYDDRTIFIRLNGFALKVADGETAPAGLTPLAKAVANPRNYRPGASEGFQVYVMVKTAP
ncbi:MAG: hypothetical protein NTW86_02030 [Candidatus Sumerlaeota bacterium]|nr:hypothetical protein [Candidatus Sumerlaeota bacterium]